MATKFGVNQIKSASPAWVVGFLAGLTLMLQGIPKIVEASTILDPSTKEAVDMICDILNMAVAAFAPLIGLNNNTNANDTTAPNEGNSN